MNPGPIFILGDLRTGRQWRSSLKVLTKACGLARSAETDTAMILMGGAEPASSDRIDLSGCVPMPEAAREALHCGARTVYCLTHDDLAVARTDVYARVLADFTRQRSPWLVLLVLNDFGRETAALCAQYCEAGLVADCVDLVYQQGRFIGRCPAWGGQIMADITLADGWSSAFVTVQPHGVSPAEVSNTQGIIEKIPLNQVKIPIGLTLEKRSLQAAQARRLEEAETIVVGGAGLGDMRGFGLVRDLAAALGAEVGATRPPVLHHWVDESRLIGQTGKTVHPRLLISIGTSGAVQYTAGIMEAEIIVAVNRDPGAPIFQWADIGVIADAQTFLPLLTQRAKQAVLRRMADAACTLGTMEETAAPSGFGTLVRQLREARNWSREELAQTTGQTPDFIAQMEADQLSPPVSFILRMAQAMQVDPGTFLNKEEKAAIRDRRKQAYYQRTQHYSYITLTPDAENSHLRAFMVTIEARHVHKPVAYKHEGEEFIYVMEGDLELTLGTRAHVLKPGESIHFNSDVPHKLKSLSNQPTRCLVVLYTI